jgi:hypothetical protein
MTSFEAGFGRSRRGNLWRTWDGLTLTVFERPSGEFEWCVAEGDSLRFSSGGWASEEEALVALACELGLGD